MQVLNGLDNLEARKHVNRLCLAAEVPLVESGTQGYLGQVNTWLHLGLLFESVRVKGLGPKQGLQYYSHLSQILPQSLALRFTFGVEILPGNRNPTC